MGLAILCPGQASQSPAMFDLACESERGRSVVAALGEALEMDARAYAHGAGADLGSNTIAQPFVVAAGLAIWEALREDLPPLAVIAGYSVGEVTAAACAGAMDADAAIRLAQGRAAAMSAASREPMGMLAVRGLSETVLREQAASTGVEIAIRNGPDHILVAGGRDALDSFCAAVPAGAITPLPIGIASHSSMMQPAVGPVAAAFDEISPRAPMTTMLSGRDGTPLRTAAALRTSLLESLVSTLDWSACLDAMPEYGATAFLELGPGDALTRMVAQRFPDLPARSVAHFSSLNGVSAWARSVA